MNRKLSEAYFAECEGDERIHAQGPYAPNGSPSVALFNDFYRDVERHHIHAEAPWSFWEFEDLNLVVAGLNSTMKREPPRRADHYGWVGEAAAPVVRGPAGALRRTRAGSGSGVVHHNIVRGAIDDDENLRDADRLNDRARRRT